MKRAHITYSWECLQLCKANDFPTWEVSMWNLFSPVSALPVWWRYP